MKRDNLIILAVAVIATVALGAPSHGETLVTLGSAVAPAGGATVIVPVYVRMAGGGQLGPDQPSGYAAQGLALKVVYAPVEAVAAIKIRRAGVTAPLSPLFETFVRSRDGVAMIVSFQESTQRIPLTLSSDGLGDTVAEVEVSLAPDVREGTVVTLRFDRKTSALSNQAGTVLESAANGHLRFRDGHIVVGRVVQRHLREMAP